MSVQAMSYVIDHSQQKGASLLCLLMIANHADRFGHNSFPSYETLAVECRMSKRQMIRVVDNLIQSGELRLRSRGGPGKSNSFQVVMDGSDKMSPGGSDKMSPGGSDKMSLRKKRHGDIGDTGMVTSATKDGDTAMSPEPKRTILEPEEGEGEGPPLPPRDFWKEGKWEKEDKWLFDFLSRQQFLPEARQYLLSNPIWWSQVGSACRGLNTAFLETEFAKLAAAIEEGSIKKPVGRKQWMKRVRKWLIDETRWREEQARRAEKKRAAG